MGSPIIEIWYKSTRIEMSILRLIRVEPWKIYIPSASVFLQWQEVFYVLKYCWPAINIDKIIY